MVKERKVRSDKKREIQPTILKELRNCIHQISSITKRPIKEVGERMCIYGTKRNKIITHISLNFKRDIRIDSTLYLGDVNRPSVKKRTSSGQTAPISLRVASDTYEVISALSYALDCTISRACAILLEATIRDVDFINQFVESYLYEHINEERMHELKQLLKYVNTNNPYSETISLSNFLTYLKDEISNTVEDVSESVSDFIIHNWRK